MFKKTITFSELNNGGTSIASELKDGEVLQIFHRGSEVKVMMTQEYYFTLLARLEKAEGSNKSPFNAEELMKSFDEKVKKLDDLLKRDSPKSKTGRTA